MLPVPKKAVKIKKIWSVSRTTQRPQPKMSQICQQRKRRPAWQYYVEQEQQHSSDKLSFVYPWWLQTTMLLLSALWRVLLKHRHMNAGQTKRLTFHMQSQILKKKKNTHTQKNTQIFLSVLAKKLLWNRETKSVNSDSCKATCSALWYWFDKEAERIQKRKPCVDRQSEDVCWTAQYPSCPVPRGCAWSWPPHPPGRKERNKPPLMCDIWFITAYKLLH